MSALLAQRSRRDESRVSLKVSLLLALDEFLFEDLPRNGRLLSIWGPRSRLQPPCADETEALAACEQMEQPLQALL